MALSDDFLDESVQRGLRLERFKVSLSITLQRHFRRLVRELSLKIEEHDPTGTLVQQTKFKRNLKLLREAITIIREGYLFVEKVMRDDLLGLAKAEASSIITQLNGTVGVDLFRSLLTPEHLRNVVGDTLVQKAPSKDWWKRQSVQFQQRFSDEMRQGLLQDDDLPRLKQRIRGTRANQFRDGIAAISSRNAEALIRTSAQTVVNQTRLDTYQNNIDVIRAIQWVSTLDNRTTDICMGLSGLTWRINEGGDYIPDGHGVAFPGPTAHWNCRSTQIAVTRPWNQLTRRGAVRKPNGRRSSIDELFRDELAKQGRTPDEIDQILRRTRSSMDGQVAVDLSFDEWLGGKSEVFQNRQLGVGRAQLFRDGKITLNQLIDNRARPLTLAQLENR